MNQRSLRALIGLNLALLAALVVVGLSPQPASAQFAPRGEYIMIAGSSAERRESIIYVVDVKSARMAALIFRSSDRTFEGIGLRDVGTDAGMTGAGRGR